MAIKPIVDEAIVSIDRYRTILEDEKTELEEDLKIVRNSDDTSDEHYDEIEDLENRIEVAENRILNATRAIDALEDIDL